MMMIRMLWKEKVKVDEGEYVDVVVEDIDGDVGDDGDGGEEDDDDEWAPEGGCE